MANSPILLVYYSRSGTTRAVAQAVEAALHCDREEILETKSRRGIVGYLRSAVEARRARPARTIRPGVNDPSLYDLVIIGTPVWAWSVSSPVRAYMMANRARLPAVAFFCTMGGSGCDSAFAQMRELAGKAPRARLFLTARQVTKGRYEQRIAAFVQALTAAAPPPSPDDQAKVAKTSSTALS